MAAVQCDYAFDAQGQEVHISEAVRGDSYRCQHCNKPLIAKRGEINEDHFAHKVVDTIRPCTFSNESYRHAKAKQLLVARLRVMVPAVYAAPPEGYVGKVPRLALPREVVAASAVRERNIYVTEDAELIVEPRVPGVPFDEQDGRRRLLARPDVVFYDEEGHPILLIEIHAEHRCGEEKIARLRQYGVDTIEISIPRNFDASAIEALFDVTRNTIWLYNGQRASFHFTPSDSLLSGEGSISTAELQGTISDRSETLKCRINRLEGILFAVRGLLGTADVEQENARYREHAQRGQEYIAELRAKRSERDTRLGEGIRARVDQERSRLAERRAELGDAEEELQGQIRKLSAAEGRLDRQITAGEQQITEVLSYLKRRAKRLSEAVFSRRSSLRIQLADRERTLERVREREYSRQRTELDREESELDKETKRLDAEEAGLAAEAPGLGTAEATAQRDAGRRISDLTETERKTLLFESYYQELQKLESTVGAEG
jgi:hypothetical protein